VVKLDPAYRPLVITVFLVVMAFVATPFRYWPALAIALKAVSMIGLCALVIHRYLRK
jgi:hypothetical protein